MKESKERKLILNKLHEQLLEQRNKLIGKNILTELGERRSIASDDISSSAAENASENEFIALTSQNNQVLLQVMEALRQVDAGNYGQCVDCDKPIPIERMKALNYAIRCVKCQEKVGSKKFLNSEFSGVERDDE